MNRYQTLSNVVRAYMHGFDVHFKYSLLLFTSLKSTLFLNFFVILPYTTFFIDLFNAFPSWSPVFSASNLCFFLYQTLYKILVIFIDKILIHDVLFFLFLMVVLNRVASFCNVAHILLFTTNSFTIQ